MRFETEHDLGEIVFLFTDPRQLPRVITQVEFDLAGSKLYYLATADTYSVHAETEFSNSQNALNLFIEQQAKENENGQV